ncbi:hypothetical protein FSP39_008157 [Pinctada imbricata]|uniref:C-type lectin domain-containing protein n=1 Tax=Pinctada imbricata TaxID=66713 RepID=A0AA88YN88_PINIB|nr:hypothetical protein FSP39_008157 [Pinctada imbricata]
MERIFMLLWLVFAVSVIQDTAGNDVDRCPDNLPRTDNLKAFREKCYEFHNVEKSWYSARDFCTSLGGWLVQIRDWPTQSFVHNVLISLNWNRNGVWLGAHDLDYEGQWKWVQGYPLTFTNWALGQPGGCQVVVVCVEDCANLRLDDNGLWHDYPCDMEPYSFVCEYEMLPETTTTTPTTTTTLQTTTTLPNTTLPNTTVSTPSSSTTTNITTVPATSSLSTALSSTSSMSSSSTQNTTLSSASVSMTTKYSTSTQETSRTSTSSVHTTVETTTSGIMGPDRQKSGENSKSGMTHGEVAGLAVALLGLAFLSGVICTYFAVKKHRRNKSLETPRTDDVHYVVQPSNQAAIDERRLVLNILYSVPDSPPKYEDIDHNNGQSRLQNNVGNIEQKRPLDGALVSRDSYLGKSPVVDSNTSVPYSDKGEFVELPVDDDDTYCTHDDTVFYKEKSEPEAKYEIPAGSNHPYRKVSKTQKYETGDDSNADHVLYDDANPGIEVKDDHSDLDLEEQHIYCAMIDVHQPEVEVKPLNDSVYEEPISAKALDDYLSHKYSTRAINDEYICSDSIGADSASSDTESKISEEGAMKELEAVLAEYDVVPGTSRDNSMTHDVNSKDNEATPYEIPKNVDKVKEYDSTGSCDSARLAVPDDAYLLVCDNDASHDVISGIDNPTYSG